MLTITIPAVDEFNDDTQEFVTAEETVLELEHSLISLSKWESKWEKPFLSHTQHTDEEALSYITLMTLTPNIPSEVYHRLTQDNLLQINNYINAKMSATWFTDKPGPSKSREIITSEVIYHWMYTAQIDQAWENQHLNRLFTLIKVFNEKNAPDSKKKLNTRDALAQQRALNAKRQAEMGTRG